MNHLLNQIHLTVNRQLQNVGFTRAGTVSSVNPTDGTIKVLLHPEESETGFIPYCTPWIGWYAMPRSGDQVIVLFQNGSKNVPIGALSVYWNNSRPPQNVAIGEAIFKHSSGSYIKLNNDGSVHIQAASIILDSDSVDAEFLAKFNELKNYIDNHIHSNVEPGSGESGPPSQPLPSNVSTSIVKGA